MLIRGTYALCSQCSSELSLSSNVIQIGKAGVDGFIYRGRCPSCSTLTEVVVDRDAYRAGLKYLKQTAINRNATHTIFDPVSPEEEELVDFANFLETADTDTIYAELFQA